MSQEQHSKSIFYIKQMLSLQERINLHIHPQWRQQGYAWYRAIWTECAELLDHIGWKWWKHNPPNIEQIHLEIIDIWHFGLSDCLQNSQDENTIAHALDKLALADIQTHEPEQQKSPELDREKLLHCVEQVADGCLTLNRFPLEAFCELLNEANLSLTELFRLYIGKNVLNQFRQDFGYKTGSYQKRWQGLEDNEHLTQVLSELDPTHPEFKEEIYQGLKARYPKVSEPA